MKAVFVFALLTTYAVALTDVLAGTAPPTEQKALRVYEDRHLTSMCLIGSMSGAFIAVAIWPPKQRIKPGEDEATRMELHKDETSSIRSLCWKFGVSMFAGCTLTPMLMEWRGLDTNTDFVLGTSTVVSASFVYVVHKLLPLVDKMAESGSFLQAVLSLLTKKK